MKQKLNTSSKPLGNLYNFLTWFEFWHPRKAASMSAEDKFNVDNRYSNAEQDRLEAEMSYKLSEIQRKVQEQQMETITTISIALVIGVIVFVVAKYI